MDFFLSTIAYLPGMLPPTKNCLRLLKEILKISIHFFTNTESAVILSGGYMPLSRVGMLITEGPIDRVY